LDVLSHQVFNGAIVPAVAQAVSAADPPDPAPAARPTRIR
jgi:hypothetical protein